ncbi:MAG: HepT-like ribonuclease domain-containing protein [Candidatus Dormibacteraceae bacterium]
MNEIAVEGLRQMHSHAQVAVGYAQGHSKWHEDQFAIDAIAKRVELVAEVAGYRIPRSLWAEYPSIPWLQIVGMRHRLVHGYDRMDIEVLVETVNRDLPRLIEQIDKLLEESASQ